MMQQREEKIKILKQALEKAKDERYKAEAKMEQLQWEEKKILEELREQNVDPERLDEEIAALEREIDEKIKEAWALLPEELLKKNE